MEMAAVIMLMLSQIFQQLLPHEYYGVAHKIHTNISAISTVLIFHPV